MSSGDVSDRRRRKRVRTRLQVYLWNDQVEINGFTADLSTSGMFVQTSNLLPLGTRLHFELRYGDGESFFGEARVARHRKVPQYARAQVRQGIGLQAVPLSEATRRIATTERIAAGSHGLRLDLADAAQLAQVYERDIRQGGVMVPCDPMPQLGVDIQLELLLPHPLGSRECKGRVVTRLPDLPGVAVELEDVDALSSQIEDLLGAARGS